MKTSYLLPHKFRSVGWSFFIVGLLAGIIFYIIRDDFDDVLTTNVLSIYKGDSLFGGDAGFFKIIKNGILDDILALLIIIGGLFIGFSKEKEEDEFIYKLRKDSLVWAIIFNYIVLIFTIIFVYDFTFFHVLVFNMFTPLIFYIFRFTFLKFKAKSL